MVVKLYLLLKNRRFYGLRTKEHDEIICFLLVMHKKPGSLWVEIQLLTNVR